ncbi:MAG: class I SAM-dependent methyltransferase [Gammaproteobacteria bacterium]|nr:MAG: class I SAM-dependent methyltransferase [Gammaproteobacteria bacterium]
MDSRRNQARKLATAAVDANKPLEWFEQLYSLSVSDGAIIPWADRCINPNLIKLYDSVNHIHFGKKAIKVGCGLGDDAEWLASKGFNTSAFDISPTAISECRKRFPQSKVKYTEADLFNLPSEWLETFDLVQESYTLQVLPPELRSQAISSICRLVATGGYILFITRARGEDEHQGQMPWPLTRSEVNQFAENGFQKLFFSDYIDNEEPSVRRFSACFRKVV